MNQLVVALTGGIASGKTQVSNTLTDLGSAVIDADKVAREVVVKASAGWQAIVKRFGSEILHRDGEINRRALRKKVFHDSQALADLNAITHPLITAAIKTAIENTRHNLIVVVIPLLTAQNRQSYFDRVLVVDVHEDRQRERLQKRDQIDTPLTEKMISAQISREQRLKLADDVISNQGSLQDLNHSVTLMHGFYCHLLANQSVKK